MIYKIQTCILKVACDKIFSTKLEWLKNKFFSHMSEYDLWLFFSDFLYSFYYLILTFLKLFTQILS